MSQEFENGWGVSVGNHVVGSGMRLFHLTVLKDGIPQFNKRWGWLTEEKVAELSAIVKSWEPDQTFPDAWEDEEE